MILEDKVKHLIIENEMLRSEVHDLQIMAIAQQRHFKRQFDKLYQDLNSLVSAIKSRKI